MPATVLIASAAAPIAGPTMLTAILILGFGAAFRHAAIPSHWLPFVLVGQTRRWSRGRTLGVVLLAGSGHVLTNSLLGLGIAWFGFNIEQTGDVFLWIVGGMLIGVGLYFCWRQWRHGSLCNHDHTHPRETAAGGDGHCHDPSPSHLHWNEKLQDKALASADKGDWPAISGLFVMLTLSPCEAFLPVYLLAVPFGWHGFFLFSGVLAVATIGAMVLFTWLTLHGFKRLKLQNIERYEAGVLGVLYLVLGVVVVALEKLGLA
jgi:ABC-type nickel/cobalt efflux system permease component RcnA